jgi:GTP-binding protein
MYEIKSAEFIKSATQPRHFPELHLPEFAFVGRSNSGKSSLLNVLANRKQLARVSSTPGHTQLVNYFLINDSAYFVDLPGYGFSRAPRSVSKNWETMITGYLKTSGNIRIVFALFDIRRELSEEDILLLEWLRHFQFPFVAVLTKADKFTRVQQAAAKARYEKAVAEYGVMAVIPFSATSRIGRTEILDLIGNAIAIPDENTAAES